jgi:hypothetical protein
MVLLENLLEVSSHKFGSNLQPIIPLLLDIINKLLLILDPGRLSTSRTFPLGHVVATTRPARPGGVAQPPISLHQFFFDGKVGQ